MPGFDVVTFTSDFGLDDTFVGVCHGVLARFAPHARVIDLTHAVAPQDVPQGAVLLARAVTYLPVAVHLAVVDPGVGSERRGVAVVTARGDVLVGPDNGLLLPAAATLGGTVVAFELAAPGFRLTPTSATFHGRDVFAPAAGAVASGTSPQQLGPEVDDLVDIPLTAARVEGDTVVAEIVLIDRFGNAQLAAGGDLLAVAPGSDVTVSMPDGSQRRLPYVATFAALAPGQPGLLVDSDRQLALVVGRGSAAATLGLSRGALVRLSPLP